MSDTDSQPQTPADAPPMPDHAPDVHTRTRVLRRDWWRTPSDPAGHGHGLPDARQTPEPEAEAGPEEGEPSSRLGRLRHVLAQGIAAATTDVAEDEADTEDEDADDAENEAGEEPSRIARLRRALSKGGQESAPADEDDQADGEQGDEEAEPSAAPRPGASRRGPRPRPQPSREALFDWWARRDARQRFVLTNGAAAAFGAFGPGLLTYRWDVGLPQLVLSWMHDAATTSSSSSTPLVLGGLAVLGAAVGGGIAAGFVLRFVQAVPTLCRITHWCLVRVPVASAVIAVCLYNS